LARIGHAWSEGELGVATEHLATGWLRQRLLLWMLTAPPPRPGPTVVLACAPGEWHEGSLLVLGALLRRRLRPIAYLGQSVPIEELADFVRRRRPGVVVLVAMQADTAAALAGWPDWLPEAAGSGRPVVGFGGRVFTEQPEWRQRVPGVFLGSTIEEGLASIERLLG
jgi:methanogenic corrinoid protein MtbC1